MWAPSVRLKAVCLLNLLLWPYDQQVCTLLLGSRSEARHVDVTLLHNATTVTIVGPGTKVSAQWRVKQTKASVQEFRIDTLVGDSYSVVAFDFHLERNSASFLPIVVIPSLGNKHPVSDRVVAQMKTAETNRKLGRLSNIKKR